MGMAERTILNTFHHQGLELFYATSDLKLVSWSLHNPSINLGDSVSSSCAASGSTRT